MALFVVHEKRNERTTFCWRNQSCFSKWITNKKTCLKCGVKFIAVGNIKYNFVKHCIRYYLTNWSQHTRGTHRKALPCAVNPLLETIKKHIDRFPLQYSYTQYSFALHYLATSPSQQVIATLILLHRSFPLSVFLLQSLYHSKHNVTKTASHFTTYCFPGWPLLPQLTDKVGWPEYI